MIVSPSVSVIAAGLASGICFLIYSSIRKRRTAESSEQTKPFITDDDNRCVCCLKPFLIGRGVRCNDCAARSCRKSCSRWDVSDNAWRCLFCHQRSSRAKRNEKEFETFAERDIDEEKLRRCFGTAKLQSNAAGAENASTSSSLDVAAAGHKESNAMEEIRDFIERIVEGLIGNIDDMPIDRLYDHPEYKPSSSDAPSMAHAALRELVECAVDKTKKLSDLGTFADSSKNQENQERRDVVEHSYEDLLATAVLNKVIEKFQKEQIDGNSNVLRGKPSPRPMKCTLSDTELGLDEGVEESNSSLEPLSQDDCSSDCNAARIRNMRNRVEPISLTIEERIEEVTTTYASDDELRDTDCNALNITKARRVPFPEFGMDIIDPSQDLSDESQDEQEATAHVDLVTPVESWEDNWLFQKKRVQTQPDPVAMLVPNPSADFKALIGDKDAEDTSDLSECSSTQSDEEIENELMEAINNVVPRTPRISETSLDALRNCNDNEDEDIVNDSTNVYDNRPNDLDNLAKVLPSGCPSDINEQESNQRLEEAVNEEKKEEIRNGVTRFERGTSERPNKNIKTLPLILDSDLGSDKDTTLVKLERPKAENIDPSKDKEEIREEVQKLVEGLPCVQEIESTRNVATIAAESIMQSSNSLEFVKRKELHDADPIMNSTNDKMSEEKISMEVPKTSSFIDTVESETTKDSNGSDVVFQTKEKEISPIDAPLQDIKKESTNMVESNAHIEGNKSTSSCFLDVDTKIDLLCEDAQQESEYTEHYDIATQRHLDSLTKIDVVTEECYDVTNNDDSAMNKTSKCREAVAFAKAESASYSSLTTRSDEDLRLATPPRPGTIAEREHRKWENAPPIENNPYSEESIQRRLWQRQYSKTLSDIPGIQADLPKKNETNDLDVILGQNKTDIQRFGRDYYINNSKMPCEDRTRRSMGTTSSRPSSSLSQRSGSINGTDQEQNEALFKDAELISVKMKRQNNNVETNQRRSSGRSSTNSQSSIQTINVNGDDDNSDNDDDVYLRMNDTSLDHRKDWGDQQIDDILENERKNSKNEINARLNNQENICDNKNSSIMDTKRPYANENQRKIRRIDLKAYGFENEFGLHKDKTTKSTTQRVINKLDLKSFGYDGGLRRTQSHNQIDRSTINDADFKSKTVRLTSKSNLAQHNEREKLENDQEEFDYEIATDDRNLTKSTEALNNIVGDPYDIFGCITSAKSVPNIAKSEYSTTNSSDETHMGMVDEDNEKSESENESPTWNVSNRVSDRTNMPNKEDLTMIIKNHEFLENDVEKDSDSSSSNYTSNDNAKKSSIEKTKSKDVVNEKVPMPSVRRLAEAFSKPPEPVPIPASRTVKQNVNTSERSATPEIHIVETPKQMHSLTARSLSKQFREGLRQIPNKVTSPPASHVAMEQQNVVPENQTMIVVQSKGDSALNDVNVIAPGKLKTNIIFWEQMQKKS